MSKAHTISEIYDIATAFITDRKTTVDVSHSNGHLMYKFTKRGLAEYPYTLVISAERGAPAKIPHTNQTNKKRDTFTCNVALRCLGCTAHEQLFPPKPNTT